MKLISNGSLTRTIFNHSSHLLNYCIGDMRFSALAILTYFVSSIVSRSALKYMIRIATRGIITFMTSLHSFWHCAIHTFPCKTMGGDIMVNNPKSPIPFRVWLPFPHPAFIGIALLNLFPESLFDGFSLFKSIGMSRSKWQWHPYDSIALAVRLFCERSTNSTSTLTHPCRIWIFITERIVSMNKSLWLSFDPSISSDSSIRNISCLTTTALA